MSLELDTLTTHGILANAPPAHANNGETKVFPALNPSSAELELQQSSTNEDDTFPGDHGALSAYLVLAGSWLMLFPTFGLIVSVGTIQAYLQHNQLRAYSVQEVSWIPSVFVYLSLALGVCVGPLLDRHPPRWIMFAGSVGYLVMIFTLAECKTYWQFLLCLGVLGGACAAALTTTGLQVLSHWFKSKRGLASGLAMVGNSFGGVVIPLVLRTTFPKCGYAWSIRILGFIFTACLIGANLLVRPRLAPSPDAKKAKVFSMELFGQSRFSYFTASVFGIETVLFGSLGILPTYATLGTGYPPETAFYVISVLNAASCFGRIVPGFASDTWGRFNTLGISLVVTLFFMLVVWLPFGHESVVALYVFVALFGFGSGCWMAMTPACLGQLSGPYHFGRYFGTSYFIGSLATLVAIPISGELVSKVGPDPLIGFMCGMLILATVTFCLSRWACLGWKWSWKTVI